MTEANFGSENPANAADNGAPQQPSEPKQAGSPQNNWSQDPTTPYNQAAPHHFPPQQGTQDQGTQNQAPQPHWNQQNWNQAPAPQQAPNSYGPPQPNFQNQQGFTGQPTENGKSSQVSVLKKLDFSDKTVLWLTCAAAAALVTFIGSFMTWATIQAPLWGTINVSGTDGDGMITLIFALILIVGIAAMLFAGWLARKTWRAIPVIVIGALLLLIAIFDWANLGSAVDAEYSDLVNVSVGAGLILILLSSIAIIVFGVLALLNDKKSEPGTPQAGFPQNNFGTQPPQGWQASAPQGGQGWQNNGQQPNQGWNNQDWQSHRPEDPEQPRG